MDDAAARRRRADRRATLVPALLVAIAYVDPGNFGTNIAAGAEHGFGLVWVVVLASGCAAVVQYLAAKLGLATGGSLAQYVAGRLPRVPRLLAWAQAELVVVMTDLTEIVGGALGLQLLVGLPLVWGAVLVGVVTFAALGLGRGRHRPIALGLLAVVAIAVVAATARLGPAWTGLAGAAAPATIAGSLRGSGLLLAAGIVGATVMPHALYFHSAESGSRATHAPEPERGAQLRARLVRSIVVAMTLAGAVNLLLLVLGTALPGHGSVEGAYAALLEGGRHATAVLLGIALVASGFASAIVGAWTGQSVMAGFLRVRIAPWKRRLVAVLPPVALLAAGVDPAVALVHSQVVLGLALPLTLLPLVVATGRARVMGPLRNGPVLAVVAWTVTIAITVLDLALLVGLGR